MKTYISAVNVTRTEADSVHSECAVTGLQASPRLGSVGSTPAVDSIKALAKGHSSSKSVSLLASGCSYTGRSPPDYIAGAPFPVQHVHLPPEQTWRVMWSEVV